MIKDFLINDIFIVFIKLIKKNSAVGAERNLNNKKNVLTLNYEVESVENKILVLNQMIE
jgi:hypothetical protein